ncbi:hypothetical protein [Novipirellula caenicola]|uniref:Secreted protein n=1 Tax=Novipirellula caenicola TaxID=1536901 RepID=A0ABP9VVS8_9BACT
MTKISSHLLCFGILLSSAFVLLGCSEPEPEATSLNELDQFLADNPDIVEQARLEAEKEDAIAEEGVDIGDEL